MKLFVALLIKICILYSFAYMETAVEIRVARFVQKISVEKSSFIRMERSNIYNIYNATQL